jgi:cell wall-associated NlpC family hydrolase
MTTRQDIVDEARRWIGTRWQHQGALRGVGVDCIGLLIGVAYALGIDDAREQRRAFEFRGYGRMPDPELLLRAASEYLDPADGPELGGIALMRFTGSPTHFAIVSCLEPLTIIHAYAQARKVVENSMDAVWRSRVVRWYRFRGIDG